MERAFIAELLLATHVLIPVLIVAEGQAILVRVVMVPGGLALMATTKLDGVIVILRFIKSNLVLPRHPHPGRLVAAVEVEEVPAHQIQTHPVR